MKKILVTGGMGFIGSHVVQNLLNKGYKPIIFDHKMSEYPKGCDFVLGDVKSYTDVAEAVAMSDGVIHLAGVLGTQETIREPEPAVETNILGGLNVFKAIEHYKVKGVYIAVGNHWMNNSYSITKTTAERFAFMFNKERGTKIAVVRGLNAYGEGQKDKPVKKIMPNFIIPALEDREIEVYGDGEQVMDMIYVKDLADILVRAVTEDHGVYDKVFEAGTGVKTTVNDIANEVIKVVGKGKIKHLPMRPGEPENSVVVGDPETLKLLYGGIIPQLTPLTEGIENAVAYFQSL